MGAVEYEEAGNFIKENLKFAAAWLGEDGKPSAVSEPLPIRYVSPFQFKRTPLLTELNRLTNHFIADVNFALSTSQELIFLNAVAVNINSSYRTYAGDTGNFIYSIEASLTADTGSLMMRFQIWSRNVDCK